MKYEHRINMIKSAIIAACANGPVPFGAIQRAVNIVGETFWGDISRLGFTLPAHHFTLQLVNDGKIVRTGAIESEDGATYEAYESKAQTKASGIHK